MKEMATGFLLVVFLFSFGNCLSPCEETDAFNIDDLLMISLWPVDRRMPWVEGEHYITEKESAELQCQLPELPSHSLVTVTYTPNYVNNMRSAVVKRRNKTENSGVDYQEDDEACTVTVLNTNFSESVLHSGLVPRCGESRSILYGGRSGASLTTEITDHKGTFHLGYSVDGDRKIVSLHFPHSFLNQTGTYQCTIIRTCDPGILENRTEAEQNPVAVTKSLFLKVYKKPSYKEDFVVAISSLGIGTGALLITAFFSRGMFKID
ncbi:uncharacterized protein LOC111695739 [Eurytemora carolleeae]|uniref:uncharacterized protein LOC111695739 n=1 Tax=Eurytemora carolleeae TaxID=1294199 RepID=UPI000C785383|nr:uncharacterized protein LOC111695739 [Eurytemora carolleeae]|eukprot:XP_023320935.1 uncharacterized protein LOC111695739 [Eurytemora affinis]